MKNKKNIIKAIVVIILYLLYQTNFLFSLVNQSILRLSHGDYNITMLSKPLRITILGICDLVYIIIIIFMFKDEIKNGLIDLKKNFDKRASIAIKCWFIGCIAMVITSFIINIISKQDLSKNEAAVRDSIKLAPIYMLFTCSIVAPIFEEMVFRKSINILIKNKIIFIIVSGFLFGLLHILGNITSVFDFLYIIPYGAMGCAFAYLLSKTDNITLPIIVHMIHNTILVISQFIRG